jgi:hypothetical protein
MHPGEDFLNSFISSIRISMAKADGVLPTSGQSTSLFASKVQPRIEGRKGEDMVGVSTPLHGVAE